MHAAARSSVCVLCTHSNGDMCINNGQRNKFGIVQAWCMAIDHGNDVITITSSINECGTYSVRTVCIRSTCHYSPLPSRNRFKSGELESVRKIVWRCNCRAINLHGNYTSCCCCCSLANTKKKHRIHMHKRLNTLCHSSVSPFICFSFSVAQLSLCLFYVRCVCYNMESTFGSYWIFHVCSRRIWARYDSETPLIHSLHSHKFLSPLLLSRTIYLWFAFLPCCNYFCDIHFTSSNSNWLCLAIASSWRGKIPAETNSGSSLKPNHSNRLFYITVGESKHHSCCFFKVKIFANVVKKMFYLEKWMLYCLW